MVKGDDTTASHAVHATPVAVADDCLVVVHQRNGSVGRCIKLGRFPVRIGRDPHNEVVLEDEGVSRRHARLERRGQRTVIMDVSSKNGTFVNGVELAGVATLKTGDRIAIGSVVFKYLSGADPDTQLHEQIYLSAITDDLTDLYNKKFLTETLGREFSRARRHDRPLSLLVIDIDHFKQVNDSHGHHVGDVTLKAVADLVRSLVRSDDVAARYGGEEIAVLLPEASLTEAAVLAERLRGAIASRVVTFRDISLQVTVSIGCAQLDAGDTSPDSLFIRADEQAYCAKKSGRNCVRW